MSEESSDAKDDGNHQLVDWTKNFHLPKNATTGNGIPVPSYTKSLSVPGPLNSAKRPRGGYILLQDSHLISHLAALNSERIPERIVHAKGVGAFGYFEVTHDITKYTKAKLFENVGKRTPIAARFSNANAEQRFADTYRDSHGFSVKFYTEEGNWDVLTINAPIFYIRDPMLFPNLVHALRRNPVSNLPDADAVWDFMTQRPETVFSLCYSFSDHGIPNGYRHMNTFAVNTFKFVNADSMAVYVKFHMQTDQGVENIPQNLADELAGKDPDYYGRDLFGAIRSGNHPSWTFCVQIMTFEEAKTFRWDPFDATKVWPTEQFPLKPVGKLVFDKNPTNHFAQVEQFAISASHMVPGIEPSPDKLLQARLFAYPDTQRHRLGPNWLQLPVNRAKVVHTYDYGGPMLYDIPDEGPKYFPNTFQGYKENPRGMESIFPVTGDVDRYDSRDEDNFSQPNWFWEKLTSNAKQRLVDNLADRVILSIPRLQDACIEMFSNVHSDMGTMLQKALDDRKRRAKDICVHGEGRILEWEQTGFCNL